MILQANASTKRPDSENTPLGKTESSAVRHLRTSFQAAASRRRARQGVPKSAKYAVEQAKRKSIIKSPTNMVSFPVPCSPPPTEIKDTPTSDKSLHKTFDLPLYLGLPDHTEVPKSSIEAVDPELAKTNVIYIRDILMSTVMGPSMYAVLQKCNAKDPDVLGVGSLPQEMSIIVDDVTSILPTHMMAVHGPRPKNAPEARTKVTLFPVHSLVLAAHCAKLPAFPPYSTDTTPVETTTTREVTLPIRPLFLHSPKTFPVILEYLYLRSSDILLQRLVPLPLPTTMIEQTDQHEALARFLGTKLSVQGLFCQITVVHGIWQNVCALGIFDDELWGVINFAWKISVMSLAVATNMPGVLQSYKNTEIALEGEEEPTEPLTEDK